MSAETKNPPTDFSSFGIHVCHIYLEDRRIKSYETIEENIAWWQNPLKVMANRMNNCEGDNLNYAKEYRKTE